jgi:hypothetical protein
MRPSEGETVDMSDPNDVPRVEYTVWILRLVAWDGLLPCVVLLSPRLVEFLLPNRRGAIELTGVILPIAGFFFRVYVGRRHISSNHCSKGVRRFQLVGLGFGIFALFVIDAVVILAHVMPRGALFAHRSDVIVWCIFAGVYLAAMAAAMYPGRTVLKDEG